jgi:prepilin-type N-terminal cleavage/methylation domain-containing protein
MCTDSRIVMTRKINRIRTESDPGFTIIEIIAVLLVIGIIAAVAIVNFGVGDVQSEAQSTRLAQHLRLAQSRSLRQGSQWGVHLASGTDQYWLFRVPDDANRIIFPGEESDSVAIDSLSAPDRVTFDRFGRPCTDVDAHSPAGSDINISVSGKTLTITRETGFIQ